MDEWTNKRHVCQGGRKSNRQCKGKIVKQLVSQKTCEPLGHTHTTKTALGCRQEPFIQLPAQSVGRSASVSVDTRACDLEARGRELPSLIIASLLCLILVDRRMTTMVLFIRLIIRTFQFVFSVRTVFFSHNKSANSVFQPAYQHSRTGPIYMPRQAVHLSRPRPHCLPALIVISSSHRLF
jgi:hypothetical protein